MSTSDVLKVLKIKTFKTSRVTINPEMHEQVHTILLFIIYSTKLFRRRLFFFELFVLVFFNFWVYFSDRRLSVAIQPGLCSFQRVFFSHFLQVDQRCFGRQSKPTLRHFFFIWCTNMALPQCFHDSFRIALYNLYLHSITYLCIRH